MVLVRSDLEFDLKYVEVDVQGRYVLVEADVQGSNFLFVNVYAPDKVQEQCLFFDNLNEIIENFVVDKEQKKIVIGGGEGLTSRLIPTSTVLVATLLKHRHARRARVIFLIKRLWR